MNRAGWVWTGLLDPDRTGWVWTGLDGAQTEQGIGLDAWLWTGPDGYGQD
jgi:hypothetical protein